METLEQTKKAYDEILKAMKKHSGLCDFDVSDFETKFKLHLLGLELSEKYGLNLNPKRIWSFDWIECGEHLFIAHFGHKYNRTISWLDSGEQPEDEMLVFVKFPTGPYIFGDGSIFSKDYPVEFFHKFWNELLTYKPDYSDTNNKALYWKLENAKEFFNSFNDVLKKYHQLNAEDIKKRRIEKMRQELAELEAK